MADERPDALVRRQMEEGRLKEQKQHQKEAGEIVALARGSWGFDEATYNANNDSVLLRRGGMSVDLGMNRDDDNNQRQFTFNLPMEEAPRRKETMGEQIKALLGLGKSPMRVSEVTEIRMVPPRVDPNGSSEARTAMVFDGDNRPGKLLALVFIEREGIPVPESWKLVERGNIRSPLKQGQTIAGKRPDGVWYID